MGGILIPPVLERLVDSLDDYHDGIFKILSANHPNVSSMSAGPSRAATPNAAASSSSAKPDRLYIGNLSPTVDEYTLIQVLQKYGSITNLDYMFHKSGALKGKPRGYAFVQYGSKDVGFFSASSARAKADRAFFLFSLI